MAGSYTNCAPIRARGSNTATVNEQTLRSSSGGRCSSQRRGGGGGLMRCVTTMQCAQRAPGKKIKLADSKHKISTVLVLE